MYASTVRPEMRPNYRSPFLDLDSLYRWSSAFAVAVFSPMSESVWTVSVNRWCRSLQIAPLRLGVLFSGIKVAGPPIRGRLPPCKFTSPPSQNVTKSRRDVFINVNKSAENRPIRGMKFAFGTEGDHSALGLCSSSGVGRSLDSSPKHSKRPLIFLSMILVSPAGP
jgi:hypothetical protein